jgi:dTDP-4-amino-4,6-dideoxygalactose transaminase
VGLNSRLDALQAAVLGVKLRHLDDWTGGRQKNAALYSGLLSEHGVPVITPKPVPYQTRHIWNQYTIQCDRRDALQGYLRSYGIGSEIYYPIPLHLQQCFSSLGYKPGDFPISESLAVKALSLPVHSELSVDDIGTVVSRIAEFYQTVSTDEERILASRLTTGTPR